MTGYIVDERHEHTEDDLRGLMLAAIRHRAATLHPPSIAARDRDWLLADRARLVEAVREVVTAVDDGADAYEIRAELKALASVAGVPWPPRLGGAP